jgi:5-formyltetrahydrofolate cyclo-ligase
MPQNGPTIMTLDDLAARKATIRRSVLARRAKLSGDERAAAGEAVAARLAALPELAGAGAVLGFASFGTELPTDPVMGWILGSGRRLLLPFVDGPAMRAAEVRSVEDLAPGYRGIREPAKRVAVDPALAQVVLVPGVAFDAAGARIGYGGGFYDSFLAELGARGARIGLCFDVQIVDEVPMGEGDEIVDVIVTEARTIRAKSA